MNLSGLNVVFLKEMLDGLRDRRSLMSVCIAALMGPLLVGFMFNRLAEREREAQDIKIPVVGAERAPALMEWLGQQNGIEIVEGPEDPEEAVRERDEDVVVVIGDEFGKDFSEARPAEVQLVADGSRQIARSKVRRVRRLIERYSRQMAVLRLIVRGVSPAIATPIRVKDIEVSSSQQRAATLLNFIPLFVVLAAFAGGMQIATDTTAGERERGSLESLLVNPVPRESIVIGKWLAAVVFAACSVALTFFLCLAVLQRIPLNEIGIRFAIGPLEIIGVLCATLPMALLATGLQIFIATFARSFKEAQSYLGMLIMLPMLPGILSVLYPLGNQPWMIPIPILGQHVLLADVLGGKSPEPIWFAVAGLSALLAGLLCVYLTTRLFHKEKIIFGR